MWTHSLGFRRVCAPVHRPLYSRACSSLHNIHTRARKRRLRSKKARLERPAQLPRWGTLKLGKRIPNLGRWDVLRATVVDDGFYGAIRGVRRGETRKVLLLAAIEDHREGRYHASVPVALAQLDGIASDLTSAKFFVKNPSR